jgi:hypothetical protein
MIHGDGERAPELCAAVVQDCEAIFVPDLKVRKELADRVSLARQLNPLLGCAEDVAKNSEKQYFDPHVLSILPR